MKLHCEKMDISEYKKNKKSVKFKELCIIDLIMLESTSVTLIRVTGLCPLAYKSQNIFHSHGKCYYSTSHDLFYIVHQKAQLLRGLITSV